MSGMPWQKIMGKIGNRAGAATGMGMGLGQIIQGSAAKKRAIEATPEMMDPTQGAFLAELQQKKNALNTGAEYTSSLDAIGDRMAQTQDVLAGNSGGDAGGTIAALLKSQQTANQGEGQILGQGQQSEALYNGMYGDLLNKMAQRKMELGLLSRAQNMATWAQKSQNGMSNLVAGAQSFMDWNGGDKKAFTPANDGASAGPVSGGGGVGGNGAGDLRQGIKGFNLGGQGKSVAGNAPLNMGSTNPLGSLMGKGSASNGVNLSSLGSKFDLSKAGSLLSSFGGK